MLDKQAIFGLLNEKAIPFTFTDHPAAHTIEEIDGMALPHPAHVVKNLFLRDDKKRNYYLLCLRKDKTADLKKLRVLLESRPLSFAGEGDLAAFLGLSKGAVTPLGILNDAECRVQLVLDADLKALAFIGVHPNTNTCTLWLQTMDLVRLSEDTGHTVRWVQI